MQLKNRYQAFKASLEQSNIPHAKGGVLAVIAAVCLLTFIFIYQNR